MNESPNLLQQVLGWNSLKHPQGIKALKLDGKSIICIWKENNIVIHEISLDFIGRGILNRTPKDDVINKNNFTLSSRVVNLYNLDDSIFAVVNDGIIYSFQSSRENTGSETQSMEIDDMFSSPTYISLPSTWKENITTKIDCCDHTLSACQLTNGLAVLARVEGHLSLLVYSVPHLSLHFILDLRKYNSQEAVVSSCAISSLAPSLKKNFQEQLEVLDTDIVVVGLHSGLVLWFFANTPVKTPSILCNTHQRVQAIHWLRDPCGLNTHLIIVLSSGRVVIYAGQGVTNLSLPDSVHASMCLRNCVVSSNLSDCYTNELQLEEELTFKSVLLPVKGVCAMSEVPESDSSLIVATIHGSVYCFNPTITPSESSTQFMLPDQSILDSMLVQTQELGKIYKQLNQENETTKAVSAAMAANGFPDLFQLAVKVTSDNEFIVVAKLKKSGFSFSPEIWMSCVEIVGNNKRETFVKKLSKDFSFDFELMERTNYSLAIGEVVIVELVAFLEHKHPILAVVVGKIEIDPCHLMSSQTLVSSAPRNQETLGEILRDLNKETENPSHSQECKVVVNIPNHFAINSCLPTIIQDSQHRISEEDWNKISGGKKFNVQVSVLGIPTLLQLEPSSRILTISCRDVPLCYKVKESVLKRLQNSETKHIPESLVLDIQALYQSFEIESLRDKPDIQSLEEIRQKLRSTISAHLPI
uniref:Uncharacterized protein n=2 Tax=Graphocephala atropunctata TaxID=36148 RepID=A0A1B6LEJ2_9HEMI